MLLCRRLTPDQIAKPRYKGTTPRVGIIGVWSSFLRVVLLLLAACGIRAETAILECTSDNWADLRGRLEASRGRAQELPVDRDGRLLLAFRFAVIQGWRVDKATLLLHIADGRAPRPFRVAAAPPWPGEETSLPPISPGEGVKTNEEQQGWIKLELPQALIRLAVHGRSDGLAIWLDSGAIRVHTRESISYAPYL